MKFLFAMLLALGSFACNKQSDEVESLSLVQYNFSNAVGPDSGLVGQPAIFTVSYPYSNGCQVVDTFKEETNGNTTSIKAFGHYDKNAMCTQDVGTRSKTYTFTPSSKGTFTLRFTNIDNTYISRTITIN
jgi:hypothetical protein